MRNGGVEVELVSLLSALTRGSSSSSSSSTGAAAGAAAGAEAALGTSNRGGAGASTSLPTLQGPRRWNAEAETCPGFEEDEAGERSPPDRPRGLAEGETANREDEVVGSREGRAACWERLGADWAGRAFSSVERFVEVLMGEGGAAAKEGWEGWEGAIVGGGPLSDLSSPGEGAGEDWKAEVMDLTGEGLCLAPRVEERAKAAFLNVGFVSTPRIRASIKLGGSGGGSR